MESFLSCKPLFVDCQNITCFGGDVLSWVTGLLHYNARPFITLLNFPGNVNLWVSIPKKFTNIDDSIVTGCNLICANKILQKVIFFFNIDEPKINICELTLLAYSLKISCKHIILGLRYLFKKCIVVLYHAIFLVQMLKIFL